MEAKEAETKEERNKTVTTLGGRLLSAVAPVFCVPAGLYVVSIAVEFFQQRQDP